MSNTPKLRLEQLKTLSDDLRRYQAAKAAKLLAEQRVQAAFGPGAVVTAEDVKLVSSDAQVTA